MSFFLYLALVFLAIGVIIVISSLLRKRARKAGMKALNRHA